MTLPTTYQCQCKDLKLKKLVEEFLKIPDGANLRTTSDSSRPQIAALKKLFWTWINENQVTIPANDKQSSRTIIICDYLQEKLNEFFNKLLGNALDKESDLENFIKEEVYLVSEIAKCFPESFLDDYEHVIPEKEHTFLNIIINIISGIIGKVVDKDVYEKCSARNIELQQNYPAKKIFFTIALSGGIGKNTNEQMGNLVNRINEQCEEFKKNSLLQQRYLITEAPKTTATSGKTADAPVATTSAMNSQIPLNQPKTDPQSKNPHTGSEDQPLLEHPGQDIHKSSSILFTAAWWISLTINPIPTLTLTMLYGIGKEIREHGFKNGIANTFKKTFGGFGGIFEKIPQEEPLHPKKIQPTYWF